MESKSYQIGFAHGSSGRGTKAYAPGNRKPWGRSWEAYRAGFVDGLLAYHAQTYEREKELALLNEPRATRKRHAASR